MRTGLEKLVKKLDKLAEKFSGDLNEVQQRPVLKMCLKRLRRMVAKIESVCCTLQTMQKGIHDIYVDGVVEGFSPKSGTQHTPWGPISLQPRHEEDLKSRYDQATKEPEPKMLTGFSELTASEILGQRTPRTWSSERGRVKQLLKRLIKFCRTVIPKTVKGQKERKAERASRRPEGKAAPKAVAKGKAKAKGAPKSK